MTHQEAFATYLELRESTPDGDVASGLSHSSEGLVLFHVLEVAAYGEPRGTVTIVHDAGGHGGRYQALGERLADAGWAVALPDLRGHGKSEGERGHSAGIREVVRDLEAVQDHLAYRMPEAPKVLVGQGLGAVYALSYALEKPGSLAGLVLASPLFEPRFVLPERKTGLAKLLKRVGPTSPGSIGWRAGDRMADAQQAAALASDELAHDVITLRAGEQAAGAARAAWPRLGEVDAPVLVLSGEDDPIGDPARARSLEGGRVQVRTFAGVRHDVFHDVEREAVIRALEEFLDAKVAAPA